MDRLLSMRTFAQVVDQGSFAAAARHLELSPAVVTRLVGDLEAHLGARLLQRTTRRVALTDAGHAYLARLRTILSDIDEAEQLAQAQTREMSGVIRIAAAPSLALHVLAPLVAEFRIEHPRVVLDIHVETAAAALVEEFDLTLLVADAGFDADIVARRLIESENLLCAAPRYLQRAAPPLLPADLAGHLCLLLKPSGSTAGHGVWRLDDNAGGASVDVTVPAALMSNHIEVLLRAVLDGAGVGALPVHLAAPYLLRGELERVLPDWTTGHAFVWAALPSRKFLPARTRAFLEFLLQHTRTLRDRLDAGRREVPAVTGLLAEDARRVAARREPPANSPSFDDAQR